MTETKFTPGPWVASDEVHGKGEGIIHIKKDYEEIGTIFSSGIDGEYDSFLANAHLIAAAPELYEALDLLIDALDNEDNEIHFKKMGRKALAKARGE